MKTLFCTTLALALTACNGINLDSSSSRAGKDDASSEEQPQDKKNEGKGPADGSRLALALPDEMKGDDDEGIDVQEWEYYEKMDQDFGDLRLECDGEEIRSKHDLKGVVRGVFEVEIASKSYETSPYAESDWEDEIIGKYEKQEDGTIVLASGAVFTPPTQKEDSEDTFQSARYVFPFTCKGQAYLALDVEAERHYTVSVNLLTAEKLELAYTGWTEFDGTESEVSVKMERYFETQGKTRVAIDFGEK